MKPIFGILFAALLILSPPPAWAQWPQLAYDHPAGGVTDIKGSILNPGRTVPDANGVHYDPCPPTVFYGENAFFNSPPRHTGGDGIWATMDANPLNTGGRTQISYASADAGGYSRATASADTSSPCIVTQNGSIYMRGLGFATAQSYRRYTVGELPMEKSRVYLNWSLEGSFSSLTSEANGNANLFIYILRNPPSAPVQGIPNGSIRLVVQGIASQTSYGNYASCWESCPAPPKAANVRTGGTIDIWTALQALTGGRVSVGDSFFIGVFLEVFTDTCASWPGCASLPAFTTDFGATAYVKSNFFVPDR